MPGTRKFLSALGPGQPQGGIIYAIVCCGVERRDGLGLVGTRNNILKYMARIDGSVFDEDLPPLFDFEARFMQTDHLSRRPNAWRAGHARHCVERVNEALAGVLHRDAVEDIDLDVAAAAIAENENMGAVVLLRSRGDINRLDPIDSAGQT